MTTKQIRKLDPKETFERTTVVEGDKVTMTRAVKPAEGSPDRYAIEITLDFANVSRDDRLAMAANNAWIAVQRRWRSAYAGNPANALDASPWSAIDVQRDITDAARAQTDPVTKAVNAIDKLDDVTREAVLQRYLAEQKKGKKAA